MKAAPAGTAKKGRGERKAEADISMPDGPSLSSTDQSNQSSQSRSSARTVSLPTIGVGARKPSLAPRARQKSICPLCGSAILLRPPSVTTKATTTKAEFPSTRRTRAIVDAGGVLPMANGMEVGSSRRTRAEMADVGSGKTKEDSAMDLESTGIELIAPPTSNEHPSTTSGKPIISNPVKSSPKLAYIPLTDPDPATESLPSLTPSGLPPPSEDRPAGKRNAVGYLDLGPVGGKGKGRRQSSMKTSVVAPVDGEAKRIGDAARKAGSSPSVKKPTEEPSPTPKEKDTTSKASLPSTTKATPPTSTVPSTTSASARGPPPKKKQKTGLAKLLADSKAREQQENEKKKGVGILSLGGEWEL